MIQAASLVCLGALLACAECTPRAVSLQSGGSQTVVSNLRDDYSCSRNPEVRLQGNSVYVCGILDDSLVNEVIAVGDDIDIVHVRSGGGYGASAMRLSRWLDNSKKTLVVDELCLSACANFLVASVDHVRVPEGAVVGFHHTAITHLRRGAREDMLKPDALKNLKAKYAVPEADFYEAEGIDLKWLYAPDVLLGPECVYPLIQQVGMEAPSIFYRNTFDYWAPPASELKKINPHVVVIPVDHSQSPTANEQRTEVMHKLGGATFLETTSGIDEITYESIRFMNKLPFCHVRGMQQAPGE